MPIVFAQMELNSDQSLAFDAVKSGKNIFLTGPAGSGKSFLIRHIVEWAPTVSRTIAVTALTGCAALLLGKAKTLHSWSGIGLGKESVETLVTNILKKPKQKRVWKKTDILIIDEVSMMTPELFEKLDLIGKRIRASEKPWGGIQLILCGDFFQLPPVVKGISGEMLLPGRFAFESLVWKASHLIPVVLNKIERQTDPAFQTLLNECRIGAPSAATLALLKSRQGLDWKTQLIRPTLLFSRNADVDIINEKNIAALKKPLHMYDAETKIEKNPEDPEAEIPLGEYLTRVETKLDTDANYCAHLELCVGAQVMLLINKDIEAGLVNGSRGVIINFRTDGIPVVQFRHGDPVAIERHRWTSNDCTAVHREQIPLRVAYAITIHKSQGATLDCALVDIGSSTFEFGQAYVALSRVRSLEALYIHTLNASKIRAHPAVTKYYEELLETENKVADTPVVLASDFGADLTDEGWRSVVQVWAATEKGASCLARIEERRATIPVYPASQDVLSALRATPLKSVKVVLLGQDPYHGAGQAHGLSFSVRPGVSLPPSLKNIRKELVADLGLGESVWPAEKGTLTAWAERGVLLLNSVLTVEEGNPASHAGFGWEELTQRLLNAVVIEHKDRPLVFLAWGKVAQNVIYKLRLGAKHTVLADVHPSPLSAHHGFFGSKPFTRTNTFLESNGVAPIHWALPSAATASLSQDPGDPEA